MTKKRIITAALLVTIINFLLTSLIGQYIAIQIGTQMGQVVASGLTAAGDKNNKEDSTRIYQNMKSQSEGIRAKWQIPELIISLPAKPIINPLLKDIRQNQFNKVIHKAITLDQFRTQGLLIDYTANFLNSLSLALLVFIVLRIFNERRKKG